MTGYWAENQEDSSFPVVGQQIILLPGGKPREQLVPTIWQSEILVTGRKVTRTARFRQTATRKTRYWAESQKDSSFQTDGHQKDSLVGGKSRGQLFSSRRPPQKLAGGGNPRRQLFPSRCSPERLVAGRKANRKPREQPKESFFPAEGHQEDWLLGRKQRGRLFPTKWRSDKLVTRRNAKRTALFKQMSTRKTVTGQAIKRTAYSQEMAIK